MNKPKTSLPAHSISLVIPIRNNEITAVSQLKKCEKILSSFTKKYEIILGEDASDDNTGSILKNNFGKNKKFKLYFHKKRLGIAKNIYFIFKKARNEYIALYSVDGDWETGDLKKMLSFAFKNNVDIVVGKRIEKQGYSVPRKIVSFFYNQFPIILFGVNTIDAGSNKVMKKKVFDAVKLKSKSQFWEAELIIRAVKKGFSVDSILINYKKRVKIVSGVRFKSVLEAIKDLINLRLDLNG